MAPCTHQQYGHFIPLTTNQQQIYKVKAKAKATVKPLIQAESQTEYLALEEEWWKDAALSKPWIQVGSLKADVLIKNGGFY